MATSPVRFDVECPHNPGFSDTELKAILDHDLEHILLAISDFDQQECERFMNILHEQSQTMTDGVYMEITEALTLSHSIAPHSGLMDALRYIRYMINQPREDRYALINNQFKLDQTVEIFSRVHDSEFTIGWDGVIIHLDSVAEPDDYVANFKKFTVEFFIEFVADNPVTPSLDLYDTIKFMEDHDDFGDKSFLTTAITYEANKIDLTSIHAYSDLADLYIMGGLIDDEISDFLLDKISSVTACYDWIKAWMKNHHHRPTPGMWGDNSPYDPEWPPIPYYIDLMEVRSKVRNELPGKGSLETQFNCIIKQLSMTMQILRGDDDFSYVPEELAYGILNGDDKLPARIHELHPHVQRWLTYLARKAEILPPYPSYDATGVDFNDLPSVLPSEWLETQRIEAEGGFDVV